MKFSLYRVGGALSELDAKVYIERQADYKLRTHIGMMDYLLVIEPRQQGKTSLINHLMLKASLSDLTLVYIDVSTPESLTETRWYQTLCPRILRQLRHVIPRDRWPAVPENHTGWREFLYRLACLAKEVQQQIVIALDEIGAVSFPAATGFFSVLRDVYNSRQAETEFRHLTFMLVGAFHPRDLIQDDKISPFNIAQRVRLEDFNPAQVQELVNKGRWAGGQTNILAERIHYWTNGQPYLTQLLCSYLEPNAVSTDVDACVERLRREDENHLPPILGQLYRNEKLKEYVDKIRSGQRIKFYPHENKRQAQLELLGVIKADREGYCIIRNRIYEQALSSGSEPITTSVVKLKNGERNMVIPNELIEQMQEGNIVLFCGAGISISEGGLPGGGQLAQELTQRAQLEDVGSMTLPEIAQAYEIDQGYQSLIAYLVDRIEVHSYTPLQTQHLIADLPFKRVITTNWDNLLEEALKQARKPYDRIVRDSDVPFTNEKKVLLIKLHGSIDQKDTIVVTGDDYYDVFHRLPETANLVRGFFATKTLLFLGFGLADEDFKRLYHEVVRHLGKHKRRAYAVQLNPTQLTVKYWQQKNVQIITADATDFLEALQQRLNRDVQANHLTDGDIRHFSYISDAEPPTKGYASKATTSKRRKKAEMNHDRGLEVLKRYAEGADWYQDFDLYESQLRENLHDERRFGPSEQSRRDRARIMENLNILARKHLDISFNALCMGEDPRVKRLDKATNAEILGQIQQLKALVSEAGATERAASDRLLQAVQQGRVDQGEIAATVDALRRWAQSVQTQGLPADGDLRAAILSLTQPTEGVEGMYNYLHFVLPLLPGLLSVESEIDLNKLWAEIKERWAKPKETKGDGDITSVDTPVYGTGNRWAVLVGVNEYEDKANYGRLHVCGKDVHALQEQLVAGGYDPRRIRLLTEDTDELPTRDNILVALKAVADATEPDDLLFFYYSGHGDEIGGESYLVTRNGRRLVLDDTAVRVSRIKEILEEAPARAKVIIIDACHSGADFGGKGAKPMTAEFIRRVFEEAEGLAILASCKQGQVSYEWRAQERSAFTHFLLEAFTGKADRDNKGFVTVQDANRFVADRVKLWASQRNLSQVPTLQYNVAGDIILVRR